LLASAVEDVQDVDRLPSLLIIDQVFSDGKATDLRGNVAGGLARQGMFGEEFEPCRNPLNDAVRDTRAGALGPISKDFGQIDYG